MQRPDKSPDYLRLIASAGESAPAREDATAPRRSETLRGTGRARGNVATDDIELSKAIGEIKVRRDRLYAEAERAPPEPARRKP